MKNVKNIKRISSLLTFFAMMVSLLSAVTYADESLYITKYSIMDFSSGIPAGITSSGPSGAITENTDQDYTYGSAQKSVKIDFSKLTASASLRMLFADNNMSTNFKHYLDNGSSMKMRAFVKDGTFVKDGKTVTALINFAWSEYLNATGGAQNRPYLYVTQYPVNQDSDGQKKDGEWIEITIPLKNFRSSNSASWSYLEGLQVNVGSWSTGEISYGAPTVLYIDSVWLEGNATMFLPEDNRLLIRDRGMVYGGTSTGTSVSSDISARLYSGTERLNIKEGTSSSIASSFTPSLNTLDYKYFNMWMYLPKATADSTIDIVVYKSGQNVYHRSRIKADWSGWRLISLRTEHDFTATKNGDWADVGKVSIMINSWSHEGGTFKEDTYANVDMIWFSKEKPEPFKMVTDFVERVFVDEPIEILFTKKLSYLRFDTVTVEKEGVEITSGYHVSAKDNKLTITFDNDLEFDQTYEVKINNKLFDIDGQSLMTVDGMEPGQATNQTYTFQTEKKEDFRIKNIKFIDGDSAEMNSMPKSGKITSEVYIDNELDQEKDAILILVIYNKQNQEMVNYKFSDIRKVEPNSKTTISTSIEMSDYTGYYAKAFLWDNIIDLHSYIDYAEIN